MPASSFERRFHVPLVAAIYVLGFYSPWERYWSSGRVEPTWLSTASLLSHLGVNLGSAVLGVTVACLLLAAVGTSLRLWSAAAVYTAPQAAETIAGDYRYPRYLGSWIFHFSLVILMPPTGAIFALLAHGFLSWRLMHGNPGVEYPSATRKAAWGKAILSESYFLGYFVCFAVLAWRYDAFLLARCALLCFGGWLVLKAISFPK